MTKYFLICASKDHILLGINQGIAQAGHGRKDFISKSSKGDWIVYYSSKDAFKDGKAYQKFTAIGKITDDESYQPDTRKKFRHIEGTLIINLVMKLKYARPLKT
jgi:hypothetical protein